MKDFKYDLISVGKCCIDEMLLIPNESKENNKACIIEKRVTGGGQAATTAVIVSLLGGKSIYSGILGYDAAGTYLEDELERFEVETKYIQKEPNFETPKAIIVIKEGCGERTIYYEKRDSNFVNPIPMDEIKNTRALILDPEISVIDLQKVMELKDPDTILVYDAERYRPSINEMMIYSDFFIASETILDMDASKSRSEQFLILKDKIKGEFIITCGAHGSFWIQDQQVSHIEAFKDIQICDTTGAGDVYHAAFVYYYPRNKSVIDSMKIASVAGALSTQHLGTRDKDMFAKDIESLAKDIQVKTLSLNKFIDLLGQLD
ncbi:MAG: carbohydrate kinase family protein [Candidatus Cloacimonetes bacterium]|nr:carbohydrate kinase family protein [Candidatus Cloacimonadota bacterium]